MALLTWSKDYSVDVPEIDSQHTVLFNLVNELHTAMMNRQSQQVTRPILQRLVKYTQEHFADEEALMARANYPGLVRHRRLHEALTQQVVELMGRLDRGEAAINIQLLNFLREWLTEHIQGADKQYSPWLVRQKKAS